ncbi:hypothetical protein BBJ28_00012682 [Nothophytophthora sp. Chile5]|nr:hypothetical protein BBJ28_00012682 [Nothophytophthora sp. Chile5]
MAPPAVASTTEVKHTVGEGGAHGGGRGHGGHGHGHGEEGKAGDPAKPVVIVEPGPTGSDKLDGKGPRVTIVAARWYEKVIHSLVEACSEELLDKGVAEKDLECVEVAGAFELPFAAARVIECSGSQRPDTVICIGCFVKDATMACELMGPAVATGIMKLNVDTDVPVICGLLCCESESQAHACTTEQTSRGGGGGTKCNHGVSWAQSALEMAHLKRCLTAKRAEHSMVRGI